MAISEVAQTILDQMGGVRRLVAMLGAKDILYDAKSVQFKWPNKQRSKGNHVKITLRGDDTYDVVFTNIAGYDFKVVKEYHGIYADQLIPVFVRQTGLHLRLGSGQDKTAAKLLQVKSLMQKYNVPGKVSGRGDNWEVELPDEKAKELFERTVGKVVGNVSGYRTGYGGWVLRPNYQDPGDWNDPSSRHHYAAARVATRWLGRQVHTPQASDMDTPRGRRQRDLSEQLAGPGWRVIRQDAKETHYANQTEGCLIRVRHQAHFAHRPVILECENGFTADFQWVPEAVQAIKRGLHRQARGRVGMKRNYPPVGREERAGWDKCMDLDPNQRQRALKDVVRSMDDPGQRAFSSGWMDCWETIGKTPWDRIPDRLKG